MYLGEKSGSRPPCFFLAAIAAYKKATGLHSIGGIKRGHDRAVNSLATRGLALIGEGRAVVGRRTAAGRMRAEIGSRSAEKALSLVLLEGIQLIPSGSAFLCEPATPNPGRPANKRASLHANDEREIRIGPGQKSPRGILIFFQRAWTRLRAFDGIEWHLYDQGAVENILERTMCWF